MSAAQNENSSPWAPVQFLLGRWQVERGGQSGQGSAWCPFGEDLQGTVLVRAAAAEYLATPEHWTATVHDSLLYLYPDSAAQRFRAIYFGVEGHVIHYRVEGSEAEGMVQFLSEAAPASPSFRLTYRPVDHDTLHLTFEVAPPGTQDAFSTYLEANLRRKRSDKR